MRESPKYRVRHSEHGEPRCPGHIYTEIQNDTAFLTCNNCDAVILVIPASEAEETFTKLASREICLEECPFCDEVNILDGPKVSAYTCRNCLEPVELD